MAHIYSNHRTREGDLIPIAEMEDSHLINTIKMFLRGIIQAKELLSSDIAFDPIRGSVTQFNAEELKTKAKGLINNRLSTMNPYIVEACIRDISGEFYEMLTTAIGRDEQAVPLIQLTDVPLLTGADANNVVGENNLRGNGVTIDLDF